MRISDWSSDVCSSDLGRLEPGKDIARFRRGLPGDLACVRQCLAGAVAEVDSAPLGIGPRRIGLGIILRHVLRPLARERAHELALILEVVAAIMKVDARAVTR